MGNEKTLETNIIRMRPEAEVALKTNDLHVHYGDFEAIKGVSMEFEKNKITSLIGPERVREIDLSSFIEPDERYCSRSKGDWGNHLPRHRCQRA